MQPYTFASQPITYQVDNPKVKSTAYKPLPKYYSLQLRSWDTRSCTVAGGVYTFTLSLPRGIFKKNPILKVDRLIIRNNDFSALVGDAVSLHCRDIMQPDSFSSYTMGISDILLTFQGYNVINSATARDSVTTVLPLNTLNNNTLSFFFSNSTGILTTWNNPFSLTILLSEE